MTIEEIIKEAKEEGLYRVIGGLVMCQNDDVPASEELSKAVGWLGCAACICGEASALQEQIEAADFIVVEKKK